MDKSRIYRSISLFGDTTSSESDSTSGQLIGRILDPENSLATYIKELAIASWTAKDDTDENTLCRVLNRLAGLVSFR